MTTLVSAVIPVKDAVCLWNTFRKHFFCRACGTGRLWGRAAGRCEGTQLGQPEACLPHQTHLLRAAAVSQHWMSPPASWAWSYSVCFASAMHMHM